MYTAINTEIGDGEYNIYECRDDKGGLRKSLLISNKTAYMDPRVDYRKWLRNTLHAVLEDAIEEDEGSKKLFKNCNKYFSSMAIG